MQGKANTTMELGQLVLKCWQEVWNPRSHGYHEALGTTKLTFYDCFTPIYTQYYMHG